jgi:dTDP-glucose 4,6-dehydratase/GDP-L-fucose synthase
MITGGSGFLGSHLVRELRTRSDTVEVFVPRSNKYDLRERASIEQAFDSSNPDLVLHLTATVGGIGAKSQNPVNYFYENANMGIELLEQVRQYGVEKFTILGTICSYPKHTPVIFSEEDLYDGYPEETNAPYGIRKKDAPYMVESLSETVRFQ